MSWRMRLTAGAKSGAVVYSTIDHVLEAVTLILGQSVPYTLTIEPLGTDAGLDGKQERQ